MRISQTYRAESAPQDPKSALRRMMQRLGLTLLACTFAHWCDRLCECRRGHASRPSNFRCYWKSPVIYRQVARRSDTFRRGPRGCQAAPHNLQADTVGFESCHVQRLMSAWHRCSRRTERK